MSGRICLTNLINSSYFFLQTRPPHPHVFWRTVRRSDCSTSWPPPSSRSFAKHTKTSRGQNINNIRWEKGCLCSVNERQAVGFFRLSDKIKIKSMSQVYYIRWSERLYSSPSLCKAAHLQTPSEVKDEDEGPLQVDSSSPGSPDSSSYMSDDSRDSRVRGKVQMPPTFVWSAWLYSSDTRHLNVNNCFPKIHLRPGK